jgi:hypothetical protein
MAKKEQYINHGDDSAPAGIDSASTFAPLDRTPTDPGEGWPTVVPEGCDPAGFACPKLKTDM